VATTGEATTDAESPPRRSFARVTGFRFFSSSADAPRVRRPTDILLLVASTLTIVGLAFLAPGPTDLDTAIITLVEDLPGFVSWAWELMYALLVIWAAAILMMSLVRRGRRRLLLDYLVAAVFAYGVAVAASLAVGTSWSDTEHALVDASPPAVYVAVRLALVTAIVVTASPHVARPFRYVGRAIVLLGAVAAVVLGIALPIGALAGFVVGVTAAAVAHLALGSPGGRPTAKQVSDALADLDVEVVDVSDSIVQVPGVALFEADTPSGGELHVKVYGRDAWDGQFLASIWTALLRRGERPHLGSGRLARVEHEAVATLLAERGGVPVLPVVAVGRSLDGDAVLVSESSGRPCAHLAESAIDDELLRTTWRTVAALHELGIAHGRIDGDRIVLRLDGTVALADLGEAEIAAAHGDFMSDRARLLVITAMAAGQERAVTCAVEVIGPSGIEELLPYLQPAVLDRATRRAVADGSWSIGDLTDVAVAAAGVDAPTPLRIQRVTWRSVLVMVAIAAFTYFVLSKLMGIDFAAIWAELSSADPVWLLAGLLVAPTVQVGLSASTMGSSIRPLRFGPVLLLQYAIQFIALTLPATAARLALEIRFFERFGIAAGAALSMGLIDSFSGFTVQVALLLLIWVSDVPGLTTSITSGASTSTESSGPSLAALVAILIVVGLVLAVVVPRFRRRIRAQIPKFRASLREQVGEVRGAITVLRSPAKVFQMLGGNLTAQVLQAIVLGLCLHAFGSTAHLSQLILINTFVSLFAGLMPVPGGMGVAEAGYTAGLQAIGVPSAVAVSTAIAFRLLTFYLPPIWGGFAMRWLRRHSYV
jgi:uncharacterized membrane protein YbhN (UPF0104 family)